MKKLLLLLPVLLFACTAPSQDRVPDAEEELTQLLRDFLRGASVNDAAMHDRFWAEDLIYTSSSGERRGKAQIMEGMESAEKTTLEEAPVVYAAEDIQVQQYDDMAVVAFRLVANSNGSGAGEATHYLNSGTFVHRDGQWKVVNWQATRIPDAD